MYLYCIFFLERSAFTCTLKELTLFVIKPNNRRNVDEEKQNDPNETHYRIVELV